MVVLYDYENSPYDTTTVFPGASVYIYFWTAGGQVFCRYMRSSNNTATNNYYVRCVRGYPYGSEGLDRTGTTEPVVTRGPERGLGLQRTRRGVHRLRSTQAHDLGSTPGLSE